MKHTQQEIQSKVNRLTTDMDILIRERKDITKVIADKKKQIKYWEEMDLSQYKLI